MPSTHIGLLGLGTIGSAVADAVARHAPLIAQRAGRTPVLHRIAVRDVNKPRAVTVPPGLLTTNACALVRDPQIDVVIEAIGGVEPAVWYLAEALRAGKHVITANKLLVSTHGGSLGTLAASHSVSFRFEAAVGAALPLVQILAGSLAGDRVRSLIGVLNGTVNEVLTRVEAGASVEAALEAARAAGLAEPDPDDDVSGRDTAAKLAIIAGLAFDVPVSLADVPYEGIKDLSVAEVRAAREHGTPIRLVAAARRQQDALELGVFPARLDVRHPLAGLRGAENALLLRCDLAGEVFVRGLGAGREATASAILGDLAAVVRNGSAPSVARRAIPIVPFARSVPAVTTALHAAGSG